MKGAELIVKTLERYGVKYIFGLPGDTTHFFRALKKSRMQFVTMHDERSAGFAADAYARVSGMPGVVYSSRGPGGTNAITGIASSFQDSSPTLHIIDQVSRKKIFPRTHMCIALEESVKPVVKGVDVVVRAGDIPKLLARAWSSLQAHPRGPWCLIVPEDVLDEETRLRFLKPPYIKQKDETSRALQRLAHYFDQFSRPIVVFGPGCIPYPDLCRTFVEHFKIPCFTTRLAKGVVPEDHPLSYGALATRAQHNTYKGVFGDADCVITLGYDYADRARPELWKSCAPHIKNLNVSHFIGKKPPWFSPDDEYVVDIGNFLRRAVETFSSRHWSHASLYSPERRQKRRRSRLHTYFGHQLLYDILGEQGFSTLLKKKDIVISDTGFHKWYVESVFEASAPDVIFSVGLSSIGFALPAALGTALARPKSKTVAVCGDGGFLMSMAELETIRRLKLPVKIVVVADGSYGLIRRRQLEYFHSSVGVHFDNLDFRFLARAFGVDYLSIASRRDIIKKLPSFIASRTPGLAVIREAYQFRDFKRQFVRR